MTLTLERTTNAAMMPEAAYAGAAVIERLVLRDFRSYAHLKIDLDPRLVVLTGANGAGKTNLLEAISMLAPGQGLRRAKLSDLDRRDGGNWSIAARLTTGAGVNEIGTGRAVEPGGRDKRLVRVNGRPAASQAALGELLSVLWLTPAMDRLFMEGAAGRRRFLDRLVLAHDTSHLGRVTSYDQALRERLRLLREGRWEPAWLGALETRAAAGGVAIAAARRQTVRALNQVLEEEGGRFPRPHLSLSGDVEAWLDESISALDAEQKLVAALAGARRLDAASGTTSIGPHRSDLLVRDGNANQPAKECSTGQQKALLISIYLAEARRRASLQLQLPVLLLDEVAAHLDAARRRDLFSELVALGAQVWLTGTDRSIFAPLGRRAQFFTVETSELHPYDAIEPSHS